MDISPSVIFKIAKTAKEILGIAKDTKDLLPEGPKKSEITLKIEKAETDLSIAEAEAAQRLGYRLCRCTYPPQIMLFDKSANVLRCPNTECGHEIKLNAKPKSPHSDNYKGFLRR